MTRISRQLQADWPVYMSYDNGDSDTDRFYHTGKGAILEESSIFYQKRQIDIFLLAMAIGKEQKTRKPLGKPSNSIRRDALTEEEVWLMCCVALSEDDANLETIADPKKIVKICEEYANGGIKTLIQLDTQTDINNQQYEESLERALKSSMLS